MQENRKEYRKKFTSTGLVSLAGEQLAFISHDISVSGIQIELKAGRFICSVSDVRNLLNEIQDIDVFVHDLGLSANAKIVWVMEDEGRIHLGLEFVEVRHNAAKLWLKRRYYRKNMTLGAHFILHNQEFAAQTVDISVDGVRLKCAAVQGLKAGDVLKLSVKEKELKALAVVIWLNATSLHTEFGVRYIALV